MIMSTCRSVVSRCACAVRHLRGVAGVGAAGDVAAAAPVAPPPSKGALWLRSEESASQSESAPPEKKVSPRSTVGPPGGQLLQTESLFYNPIQT